MKTCQKCNTINNDNANYCRRCGSVVSTTLNTGKGVNGADLQKIGELQLLIQGYTKKLNATKKELEAVKETNKTLSSTNNSLQGEISRNRNKIASDEKEIEILRKEMESLSSNKIALHVIYIIAISILSIILLSLCNNRYTASSSNSIDNEELLGTLQYETDSLKKQNADLVTLLSTIDCDKLIFVKSIDVRNADEPYGQTIYSSNSTYLIPKIELFSFVDGYVDILVKLFSPYGLTTGDESPEGYSTKETIYLNKEKMNTIELVGWGGDQKGHWMSGKYRYEFYFDGKLIGFKDFTIQS